MINLTCVNASSAIKAGLRFYFSTKYFSSLRKIIIAEKTDILNTKSREEKTYNYGEEINRRENQLNIIAFFSSFMYHDTILHVYNPLHIIFYKEFSPDYVVLLSYTVQLKILFLGKHEIKATYFIIESITTFESQQEIRKLKTFI